MKSVDKSMDKNDYIETVSARDVAREFGLYYGLLVDPGIHETHSKPYNFQNNKFSRLVCITRKRNFVILGKQ